MATAWRSSKPWAAADAPAILYVAAADALELLYFGAYYTMNAHPRLAPATMHDPLIIAGREYRSRLLTGTGKFKDLDETRRATEAAGAQIVTVAIRRGNIGQDKR